MALVQEAPFHVETDAGTMGGMLVTPGGHPMPGVVILSEIFGVNHAMRAAAQDLAEAGFIVAVPDLFHRLEPGVALDYSPAERERGVALWKALDLDKAAADCSAAADALAAHPSCNGQVAYVGFCLGGKLAFLAAARQAVDGVVSLYPVQMQDHRDAVAAVTCPVQVHIGSDDGHVPPDALDILRRDVLARPGNEFHLHDGAGHGFYNRYRAVGYHAAAAAAAHAWMIDFLDRAFSAGEGDDA